MENRRKPITQESRDRKRAQLMKRRKKIMRIRIAAIAILGLLFYLIARILLIGIRANDPFNSMMCLGIGVLFLVSVFVNLGGITGIIPLTGITFPFISQGGSSLLMFSICIGFVLNISADERRKQYQLI